MRSLCLNLPVLKNNDLVRADHGVKPVSDDQDCLPSNDLGYSSVHFLLILGVNKGCRLVENDDRRVLQKRPCQ